MVTANEHQTPNLRQLTYFRIKATSKDGSFSYSDAITDEQLSTVNYQPRPIRSSRRVSTFLIYPNPVKEKIFIQSAKEVNIRLQNSFGQVMLTQKIKGNGSVDVSKLNAGIYYLVNADSGESFKVVKE